MKTKEQNLQRLVTILITNYNYGRFIQNAVLSAAQQTYSPIGLIIVDDGSTDNSKEVIESLISGHNNRFVDFKTLHLEKNVGINASLNRGIPLIEGDITIILDADDMLKPPYVEETTSILLKNETQGVGFVYTDNVLIDEKGNVLRDKYGKEVRLPWQDFDAELLKTKSYIPGCAATLTHVLKSALPFDESIKIHTKHPRLRKIVEIGGYRGIRIPKQLVYYRMHGDNNSGIGIPVIEAVASGKPVGGISDYWKPV